MNDIRLYPPAPALSRLILGGSTFARETLEEAAFAMMDHAYARGITLFDTAAMYSGGESERYMGRWRASRRPDPARLMIATKLYPPFTAAAMDEAVKGCAERLGVETIDVLYLHKWDAAAATPEALTALDRFVRAGRVRALGASNFTADQLQTVLNLQRQLGLAPFRILQNNHNVAVRDVDAPLLELAARHDVAIVTYSPLGGGFLTGKHRTGVAPGSRFDVAPGHQGIYFQPVPARRLDRLTAIAARTGLAMPHLALAWAMHRPGIAAVLIGGRGPAHLDQAFAALAFDAPDLFRELDEA